MIEGLMILALALLTSLVHAGPVAQGPHIEAELVSEHRSLRPGSPLWVALRLRMERGWHTYWRNPGDSGQPTTIDWRLPPGWKASPISWPFPQRLDVPPLTNFGYEGEIYLPIELSPSGSAARGASLGLSARVRTLVCQEVCIPAKLDLSLSLPMSEREPEADPRHTGGFAEARARIPRKLEGSAPNAVHDEQGVLVRMPVPAGARVDASAVELFTLDERLMQHALRPWSRVVGDQLEIRFEKSDHFTEVPSIQAVVVLGGTQAMEIDAPLTKGPTGSPSALGDLARMLLFALLGGLILNLMPCVFPVLSIKALGFVQQSAHDAPRVRRHGLMFAGGVLASFWALAGALIALRAAGQGLGWGFQLQSPLFVALLSTLLFAMALNLLGLFEIGGSLMGVGGKLAARGGYGGSFFTGVLATLVATPCTAPFMGAALGFALAQPAPVALAVFTALAVGMALPYVLLAFLPGLGRRLPKPGRWMETFKQAMAFPLLATVIWLAWVYGFQTGSEGPALLLGGHLLIAFAAWTHWRAQAGKRSPLLRLVVVAAVALGVGLPLFAARSSVPKAGSSAIAWESFSPARVAQLRAAGKPVFVDFTAAWCVSCQVNERVVLGTAEIARAFADRGIAAVKADWTQYDPVITDALASFGRAGVPLYVYYPVGEGAAPIILPEVLTAGIVLNALKSGENQR